MAGASTACKLLAVVPMITATKVRAITRALDDSTMAYQVTLMRKIAQNSATPAPILTNARAAFY